MKKNDSINGHQKCHHYYHYFFVDESVELIEEFLRIVVDVDLCCGCCCCCDVICINETGLELSLDIDDDENGDKSTVRLSSIFTEDVATVGTKRSSFTILKYFLVSTEQLSGTI